MHERALYKICKQIYNPFHILFDLTKMQPRTREGIHACPRQCLTEVMNRWSPLCLLSSDLFTNHNEQDHLPIFNLVLTKMHDLLHKQVKELIKVIWPSSLLSSDLFTNHNDHLFLVVWTAAASHACQKHPSMVERFGMGARYTASSAASNHNELAPLHHFKS